MYLQLILRNFSVRASSSSEVDDTTLDWRRLEKTGGWTPSGFAGPSESWRQKKWYFIISLILHNCNGNKSHYSLYLSVNINHKSWAMLHLIWFWTIIIYAHTFCVNLWAHCRLKQALISRHSSVHLVIHALTNLCLTSSN